MGFESKRIYNYHCNSCGETFRSYDKHSDVCPECEFLYNTSDELPVIIDKPIKKSLRNLNLDINYEG